MASNRPKMVGSEIRAIVAELVLHEMKDPGLPKILTITDVAVTRDLGMATVYFSQLPDDEESVEKTMQALRRAKGFLQTEIAHRLRMRIHPELRFYFDNSAQNYAKIDKVLKSIPKPAGEC